MRNSRWHKKLGGQPGVVFEDIFFMSKIDFDIRNSRKGVSVFNRLENKIETIITLFQNNT